jgi:hypothetical protein
MKNEKHKYIAGERELSNVCGLCRKDYFECYEWVRIWMTKKKSSLELSTGLNSGLSLGRIIYEPVLDINIDISMIDTTLYTTALLTTKGEVYSWGTNTHSLGRYEINYEECYKPRIIPALKGIVIVSISCGLEHVLALESGMYVWSWGSNGFGQLGNNEGPHEPRRIQEINQIVRIAAGHHSSFAVDMRGIIYSWGNNSKYQIGHTDSTEPHFRPAEMLIAPWLKRQMQEESGKSYFKQPQPKELKINGMSKSALKRLQIENNDLKRRINNMIKRVDILEDVLNNAARYITARWLTDDTIQNINKIKQEIEIHTEKIKLQKKEITQEAKNLSKERKEKEYSIVQIEEKLTNVQTAADEVELELVNTKKRIEKFTNESVISNGNENTNLKLQREKLEELTRQREVYYVKTNKLKHRLNKFEKEKVEIYERMSRIKENSKELRHEIKNASERLDLYDKMINIAKKKIVDYYLQSDDSYDTSLLIELNAIINIHKSISYIDSHSVKSQFPSLEKSKRYSYILKGLERFERELKSTSRITQFSLVDLVHKTWAVLSENINLRKQIINYKCVIQNFSINLTETIPNQGDEDQTLLDKFNAKTKQQPDSDTDKIKPVEDYFVKMFKEAGLDLDFFKLEEEENLHEEVPIRTTQIHRAKRQKKKESKWRLCGGLFG